MNDLNSLLVASTVLAIGGLGLFWYKNQDDDFFNDDTNVDNDDDDKSQDDYNDNDNDNNNDYNDDESHDEYYKKKNAKKNVKKPKTTITKRNLKKSTGTKRRY